MRKLLIGGVVLFLLLLALFWLRSGPTAPVPAVDPIVRWNADHADLAGNAADVYEAAFAQLHGEPDPDWSCGPLSSDAVAWVEQNQAALELARQAADYPHCWFSLQRDTNGDLLLPHLARLRALAKLLHFRALIAAQQHDAVTLADLADAVNRIAVHVDEGPPELMNALTGIAIHALAKDAVTQPMLWPELSAADRADYLARLGALFISPPPLTETLAGEQETSMWMYVTKVPASPRRDLVAAPERIAGELERYFRPLRALAALPVERQCDSNDPLVTQVQVLENEQPSKWNVPRVLASTLVPGASRALSIRARLITEQRGNQTVLELFAYRDRNGAFPESLDALAGDFRIDPFSGKPFIYRRTDEAFTLYSVGCDRKDSGGRHDRRFGEDQPDSDYVFWPIPEKPVTSALAEKRF